MRQQQVDILILIENKATADRTLASLKLVDAGFYLSPGISRFHVYSKHRALDASEIFGDVSGRFSIRRIELRQQEFLLAAVHLPSKLHVTEQEQYIEIISLSRRLREEEVRRQHTRTIVVGDLNMNPFEIGVVNTEGLHGVMTTAIAKTQSRTVSGTDYPFFYNPMWGFFGDRTQGPLGSFYYRAGHISYEWHIFDQVLFRPAALPWFDGHIEIVTRIANTDLATANGRPNATVGSDHFPLVFRLSLTPKK